MSLRTQKRNIARYRMQLCGYERMNKKRYLDGPRDKNGNIIQGKAEIRSAFGIHWRKYLDPSSKQYKSYQRVLRRVELRRMQKIYDMQTHSKVGGRKA